MTKNQYRTIAKELCYGNEILDALERAASNAERNQIMTTARQRVMEREVKRSEPKRFRPSKIGVTIYQSITALIA